MFRLLVTVIAFQVAWAATAFGVANGQPWIGIVACGSALALGFVLQSDRLTLATLAVALALFGLLAETLLAWSGVMAHRAPGPWALLAPLWVVMLWAAFATLIAPACGWLKGRPRSAALLGAAMGPATYALAWQLDALVFAEPVWHGFVGVAVVWASAMMSVMTLYAVVSDAPPRS